MRASRLLSLMFLLQSKGRMTAEELAVALAVSKRTIYRDIDALNLAGVPIYTQDGRNGGIYLDSQYRIELNSLGREEIQSLFVYPTQGPINDIGLDSAIQNALLKLLAALPARYRDEAERIRQRIHFDPSPWFYHRDVSHWMPHLLQAVFEDRTLQIRYLRSDATETERKVRPYGLVAKMDIWYLVAMTAEDETRTFRVSRIKALDLLNATFQRSPDFDLVEYWTTSTRHYAESKPRYNVTLRVAPNHAGVIRYLSEAYGAQVDPPDAGGWTPVMLSLAAMQEARMVVMGLGDRIEIIDPPELIQAVREWLDLLNKHYR